MSEKDGGGGFLSGFVVGGLAGAAIAMLLTPRPGEETRTMLAEQSSRMRSCVADMPYPESLEDMAGLAASQSDQLRGRGASALEAQVAAVQDVVKIIQEQVHELLEEKKSRVQEAVEEGKQAAAKTKEELLQKIETDARS
ncbi:MAG: hypothetical protein GXP41_06575 [Chloroflexi bacterium]|nr:hypothetical protein [Chloroflexota bacterium]